MEYAERFQFKKIHSFLVDRVFSNVPFYIVGGAVRDMLSGQLLGRDVLSHDIDFATPLTTPEIKQRLKLAGLFWTPDKTAEAHGIFRVIDPYKETDLVDIATFRNDIETDGRHAVVSFTEDIIEDLNRRDLTINAMAFRVDKDAPMIKLVDPFGGWEDLADGVIRFVGEPECRIAEDRLRMLRVARFATKLKGNISASTAVACRKHASEILEVSKERIRDEIIKALTYDKAGWMFRHMNQLGLLQHIIPDLYKGAETDQNQYHSDVVLEHLCYCVDQCIGKKYHPSLKLATLFHDIAKPHTKQIINGDATFYKHEVVGATLVYNWMKQYRFSADETKYVVKMVRHHQWYFTDDTKDKTYKRWLQEVGRDHWRDLVRLRMADRRGNRAKAGRPAITQAMKRLIRKVRSIINEKQPLFKEDLAINGHDLKALGIPPGPIYKEILSNALGIVMTSPEKNNKDWLLAHVVKSYKDPNVTSPDTMLEVRSTQDASNNLH